MHFIDYARPVRKRLLRLILDRRFAQLGKGATWDPTTSIIMGYENIALGPGCFIGPFALLSDAEGVRIEIGGDTVIGPSLIVMAGDHEFSKAGQLFRGSDPGENQSVTIEENVWIGARVTVLKGVKIGRGAVVGAGSVVVKDVPAMTVAVGNPARVMRRRFSDVEESEHRRFLDETFGHRP